MRTSIGGTLTTAMKEKMVLDPEMVARSFHEAYERLAPKYGYKTRKESAVPWKDVPEKNKKLMKAVIKELMRKGIIS